MGLRGPSDDVVGDFMGSNRGKPDSRPMQNILAERNKRVYQIKPGRGGRRSQPRPGEGSAKLIKDTAEFFEPGYVHAARTGTVPETIFGKSMLAAETALDLIPGAGKVLGMALPFGYLKKIDPTTIISMDKQSKGIHTPLKNQEVGNQVQDLVSKAVDKPALKVLRKQLRTMDDTELFEQTSGLINRNNIDKVDINTVDEITGTLDSLTGGIENALKGNPIDPSEAWKHARKSPWGEKARQFGNQAQESIIKGEEGVEAGIAAGKIKRIHGNEQTAKIVDEFVTKQAEKQAHKKAVSQVGNKSEEIARQAKSETKRVSDKYEADQVNRLWEEHAYGKEPGRAWHGEFPVNRRGHGEESADHLLEQFQADAAEDAKYVRKYKIFDQRSAITKAKIEETVKHSIPVQRKEILNQIQETGTYDPKARFPKGFGEDAEAIRGMEKQWNKKPKGGGQSFRYGQNRSPFV